MVAGLCAEQLARAPADDGIVHLVVVGLLAIVLGFWHVFPLVEAPCWWGTEMPYSLIPYPHERTSDDGMVKPRKINAWRHWGV